MATSAFTPGLVLLVVLGLCAGAYRTVVATSPTEPADRENPDRTADARQRLRDIYSAEIGVREASGRNDGSRVEEYLRYCSLGPGHAWCAAYVCWCFGKAGYDQPRNPWSPALFPAARTVRPTDKEAPAPKQGDVFGIFYPTLGRIAHVGFIDQIDGRWLVTVEGNAGNRVRRKRRHIGTIHSIADWLSAPNNN